VADVRLLCEYDNVATPRGQFSGRLVIIEYADRRLRWYLRYRLQQTRLQKRLAARWKANSDWSRRHLLLMLLLLAVGGKRG